MTLAEKARASAPSLRTLVPRGIGPRKPVKNSTWYRRRAKARSEAARQAAFASAESFVHQLQRDLKRNAAVHAAIAAIIGELAA
jgi:hypothetical protein